jgi:MFS family permease
VLQNKKSLQLFKMQQLASDGVMRDEENENSYRNMETAKPTYKLDEDDDMSIAPSIASSVMTAEGIHDPHGFAIVCLVILIGDMSRGIMFPSMWPLVSSLGGSSVTLGYSVASFSFGRILVSPLFGSRSITHGYTQTLLTSCSILLFATLAYAQIQNVGRTEFLFLSQILLGVGSGTLGVTRAFVAEVTATRNRTTYMAWVTAVQYAGFTVTPFLGALFNTILADVDVQYGYDS